MKKYIAAILVLAFISCNESKKDKPLAQAPQKTITSGLIVINISSNEYGVVTLERTIVDTVALVTTDTTGGKLIQEKKLTRDTSYKAWWPFKVPDSTGKAILKTKTGQDSIIFKWAPLQRGMVLQDYNRNWPQN